MEAMHPFLNNEWRVIGLMTLIEGMLMQASWHPKSHGGRRSVAQDQGERITALVERRSKLPLPSATSTTMQPWRQQSYGGGGC